jgi:hypothetical protein
MGTPFAGKAIAILAVLAAVTTLLAYFMYLRMRTAQRRLVKAQAAAEEAARAAALAAPGGIDPEIVLAILNQGLPPTLDNVYMLTQQKAAEGDAAARAARVS